MTKDKNSISPLAGLHFDESVMGMFEFVPNLHFFIKDGRGRLVHCNETHRRNIFRYERAGAIYGKDNYDFFPNTLAAGFAEDDRQVIETGEALYERIELNIASSGKLCWFCTTKIPARDFSGKIAGLLGISRRLRVADRRLESFGLLLSAIDYIDEHIAESIPIPELARLCQMPEVSFRREFRKQFRMSPNQFIIRLRLHNACMRLSETQAPVGEIARDCGFVDQNYFARQFKQHLGTSPREFRQSRG